MGWRALGPFRLPLAQNGIPSEMNPIAVRGAPNNRKDAPNKREDPGVYDFLTPLAQNAREPNKRKWVATHLRSKFLWAGHVARQDIHRLARRITEWRDSSWWATELQLPVRLRIRRPCRTRWFRWEDALKACATRMGWSSWQEQAQNREAWFNAVDGYVSSTR